MKFCADPNESKIDQAIRYSNILQFDIENQCNIQECLVTHMEYLPGIRIKLWQPHLIEKIIEQGRVVKSKKIKEILSPTSILHQVPIKESFDERFYYPTTIDKLNFLEK